VTHCIIFEPDPLCRRMLESALASLYWTTRTANALADVAGMLPGPWAVLIAIESGDPAALEAIREIKALAPATVVCALLDEHSPDFDKQLAEAGANSVFAKPVAEPEIVAAVVTGFTTQLG
jgi:DNA-binding response OmpR family regulator